jgi:hypothetical protein
MSTESQAAPVTAKIENAAAALLGGNPADEMPEVELQAVATTQPEQKSGKSAENQRNSVPVLVDSQGRTFDPLLHETEDGKTPLLRADGKTIKCRRVPLKEFKTTSKVQIDQPETGEATAAPEPAPIDSAKLELQRKAGARTIAGIQIFIMRRSLGEHIAGSETDQAALVECWSDLFDHYGMEKMHPIVGLAVVTGMITFDGMKEAQTRNALSRAWLWCKVQVGNLFLRTYGRKAEPETK